MHKQKYEDSQQVQAIDLRGNAREGTLEIPSSQLFIGFDKGDGIFMTHAELLQEQKVTPGVSLRIR